MVIRLPSQKYLKECLDYSEESGLLFWKARPLHHFKGGKSQTTATAQKWWNTRYSGCRAFTTVQRDRNTDYLSGRIDGVRVSAHRIVWKWVTGEDPDVIDHIDGDGLNNRFTNLRSLTNGENLRNRVNRKKHVQGIIPPVGVVWKESNKKWSASIYDRNVGKSIHLGCFLHIEDAAKARQEAEAMHGFGKYLVVKN